MAESTFCKFPYPDEYANPFWDQYESQIQAMDKLIFMRKIKENIIVGGGGIFSFVSLTGIFTWTDDFILPIYHFGKKISIQFGPDGLNRSVTIPDGYALSISIPFAMKTNETRNFSVISQLTPVDEQQFIVAFRSGSKIYFNRGLSPVGT